MWLLDRITEYGDAPALARGEDMATYADLRKEIETMRAFHIREGAVISLEGDYTAKIVARLLYLIERKAIIVPIVETVHRNEMCATAEVETAVSENAVIILGRWATHPLIVDLKARDTPGLVLFSSGSTGKQKAALHDLGPLIDRHKKRRKAYRTLTFLLLDHIGGINTLLYALANGGMVVSVEDRRPDTVCAAIEKHRVELLPTSPTFLNMLLFSEAWKRYDLSSLKLITYGTEAMPQSTLDRLREVMPHVRLKQTYGLSELGILGTKSRDDGSLWMKVGGEGFETKIVDGTLWIRSQSAMLGYLNAPSPFDEDGWMDTGDLVEVDGEWMHILGRESEIINVGGGKVYPAEVESVLLQMPGICDVVAYGMGSAIMGQIVAVDIVLQPGGLYHPRARVRDWCHGKLAAYKIPLIVNIVDNVSGDRYKRMRRRT